MRVEEGGIDGGGGGRTAGSGEVADGKEGGKKMGEKN